MTDFDSKAREIIKLWQENRGMGVGTDLQTCMSKALREAHADGARELLNRIEVLEEALESALSHLRKDGVG